MRPLRFLAWLGAAAAAGFVVFGILVWRAVDVTDTTAAEAARAFTSARNALGMTSPLLVRQADGALTRRATKAPEGPEPVSHIYVLSYRVSTSRLTKAEVPFWFFRLKAPAAQFVVRDTGLDLATLGLTAADLAAEGPTLILDETDSAGNRLLVWTE